MPSNDHIIWKFLAVVLLFGILLSSKYLGYESWDSWKDIRAAVVETLIVSVLFLMKYLGSKSGGGQS